MFLRRFGPTTAAATPEAAEGTDARVARRIRNSEELQELRARGLGLVLTDRAPRNLHSIACPIVARFVADRPRLWFESWDQALPILTREYGPEGPRWRRAQCCRHLITGSSPAIASASSPGADANPSKERSREDLPARARDRRALVAAVVIPIVVGYFTVASVVRWWPFELTVHVPTYAAAVSDQNGQVTERGVADLDAFLVAHHTEVVRLAFTFSPLGDNHTILATGRLGILRSIQFNFPCVLQPGETQGTCTTLLQFVPGPASDLGTAQASHAWVSVDGYYRVGATRSDTGFDSVDLEPVEKPS